MRSKRVRSSVAVVLALVLGALGVAACGTTAQGAGSGAPVVAVVVAQRQGSVPITDADIRGLVDHLVAEGARVSAITADGQPAATASEHLAATGPNPLFVNRAKMLEERRGDKLLLSAKATTPQSDTLTAITMAARAVSVGADRQIVVVDSGLSTVAPLAFQDGILNDDPHQVVAFLRAANELPDLGGDQVTWYALGQTTSPQAPLTTADQKRLGAIWTAILRASGARSVHMVQTPFVAAAADPSLPKVTAVPVAALESLSGVPQLSVALSPKELAFTPGEATYLDPSQAGDVLQTVAHQITAGGYV
ncbi:MAG: hypothetical protein ACRD6W_16610, partial [Nitrososphaerales archaeon]